MEKYSQWNDKSSGVNPFVPLRTYSSHGPLVRFVGGIVVVALRFPLFLISQIVLVFAELLEIVIPLSFVQRFIRYTLVALGSRLCLFALGYTSLKSQVPDVRRFRLGRQGEVPTPPFGKTIRSSDIIICNNSSIMDYLVVAYFFGADVAELRGTNQRGTGRISASRAFWRALLSHASPFRQVDTQFQEEGGSKRFSISELAALGSGSPLVVFPECAPTNGTAVLEFSEEFTNKNLGASRTHVAGVKYIGQGPSTVEGFRMQILKLLSGIQSRSVSVVCVAHETIEAAKQTSEPCYRSLLAQSVGERGVKKVAFSAKNFIEFSKTWVKNEAIALERQRKKKV